MAAKIKVMLEQLGELSFPQGTPVRQLTERMPAADPLPWIGALVNNDLVSLNYLLDVDCTVKLLTMASDQGMQIYRRSLTYLLCKAARDLYPTARFRVEHSLGQALYCTLQTPAGEPLDPEAVRRLDAYMRQAVEANRPFRRIKHPYTQALALFESMGHRDKFSLLRFSNPPKITLAECDGFVDLYHGAMAPSSGVLQWFRLCAYEEGFLLQMPTTLHPTELPPFEPLPHLFQIFREHKKWGRILGVSTAGELNEHVAGGQIAELIRTAEALQEKKLAHIADHITSRENQIQWVFIAGPSSSGKTTFAKRLATQLRVDGFKPKTISVDDYFVERAQTPRDENGEYDFEHIGALDLDLFNEHLQTLERGGEIELPRFNFQLGRREKSGQTLRMEAGDLILIEGIHALNPRMSREIPAARKRLIYISALTQLNLDDHNRVSTTDNRLIRRMVRDARFRGHSAARTLSMWPGVRRGEDRWIFPYQDQADVAFTSALDYELSVLRLFAEPLLLQIKPSEPVYADARRLQLFLSNFLPVAPTHVPPVSILREFIGNSVFEY